MIDYLILCWVGCVNELNVVYVVDGYVCMLGVGVLFIIFGVGEFSVINGIVGSYVEYVLVLYIVGVFCSVV